MLTLTDAWGLTKDEAGSSFGDNEEA